MYFLYKLTPPRPSFMQDMTEPERVAMTKHVAYWQGHLDAGRAVLFSPVADPAGAWGFAVVRAETAEEVCALGEDDPAVTAGVGTFDVYPMPNAVVP
jgi:uncharacterized protein